MLKLLQKQLDSKLIKLSLVFAFTYCLLFNFVVLMYRFYGCQATLLKAILELATDYLYIYTFSFIVFFGLTIHRLIFTVGAIFLFITGAIASYYLYCVQMFPTEEMIMELLTTDFNVIYEIISIKFIVWLVFSLFVCIYTIKHFSINNSKLFVTKLLSGICILILINNVISPQYQILNRYFPIQYLHNIYLYLSHSTTKYIIQNDARKQFTFIDNAID